MGRRNTICFKSALKVVFMRTETLWLSARQNRDLWRRWKAGQTLHEIGRAFDKPHT